MKIYFSGSIRGGRDQAEYYELIISQIGQYGVVLSEFVGDRSLTSYGSLNMTDQEIYNRDVAMINEADIIVADVTTPSLGVGYEIAIAEKLNKKIYCLYNQLDDKKASAMIAGNPNCEFFVYKNKDDVQEIIKNIFN